MTGNSMGHVEVQSEVAMTVEDIRKAIWEEGSICKSIFPHRDDSNASSWAGLTDMLAATTQTSAPRPTVRGRSAR